VRWMEQCNNCHIFNLSRKLRKLKNHFFRASNVNVCFCWVEKIWVELKPKMEYHHLYHEHSQQWLDVKPTVTGVISWVESRRLTSKFALRIGPNL
jgi:hypothetical protein